MIHNARSLIHPARSLILALAFWCACAFLSDARADNVSFCSITVPNFNFGPMVVITDNATNDLALTMNVNCRVQSGVANVNVRVCVSILAGNQGGTAAARFMKMGASQFNFAFFLNGGYATAWGTGSSPVFGSIYNTAARTVSGGDVTFNNIPINARIFANQPGVPAGIYTAVFPPGNGFKVDAGISPPFSCGLAADNTTATPANVTVTATVPNTCYFVGGPYMLTFPTSTLLTGNVDQLMTFQVNCTSGLPFQIGLDGGNAGAAGVTDPTNRKMLKGTDMIRYGLYRDNNHLQPFGNTFCPTPPSAPPPPIPFCSTGDVFSAIGTGTNQNVSVFGRVKPQPTPKMGNYSDTVIVTVQY